MADVNALVEEQNRLWAQMQEARDRAAQSGEPLDAQAREQWDKAEQRLTEISGDLDRFRRMAEMEQVDRSQILVTGQPEVDGDPNPGHGSDEDQQKRYQEAFSTYLRGGLDELDREQKQLIRSGYMRTEDRAQATAPGAAGGYLVPDEFLNRLVEPLELYGGLMAEANVIVTGTGADLEWPTNDDRGNEGALLSENTQVPEQDVEFGTRSLGAYTYTSKLVRISWQLQQDSVFDLDSWLPGKLGQRIGRAVAKHLVNGDGEKKPLGLMVNPTVGATVADGITYEALIDLEHSVARPYRSGAKFGLSDAALKAIRKIVDADGRPIWQPVPAAGMPATINGNPYFIDEGFAEPGAGAKSVAFGNFQLGYLVRRVRDVQVVRLNERYADNLQTGYFGFARLDAMPDDPEAIRVLAHDGTAPSS